MPKLSVEIELRDCDDPLATVRVDSAQLFGLFDVYSGTVWDTSMECCASRSA